MPTLLHNPIEIQIKKCYKAAGLGLSATIPAD